MKINIYSFQEMAFISFMSANGNKQATTFRALAMKFYSKLRGEATKV
jgi:hypothetical protein